MTSPTLFQKPAIGEPSRTESTELRGRVIRQLSHSIGRKKGMAEIESDPTITACTWCAFSPSQS
jgi:hypothetical protein